MITYGDFEIGPLMAQLPLAAGEEVSHEILFLVPPPAPPGTLTVMVTATEDDGVSADVATLEILDCDGGRSNNSKSLFSSDKEHGTDQWGRRAGSGVYSYKLRSQGESLAEGRLVLLR